MNDCAGSRGDHSGGYDGSKVMTEDKHLNSELRTRIEDHVDMKKDEVLTVMIKGIKSNTPIFSFYLNNKEIIFNMICEIKDDTIILKLSPPIEI